MDKKKTPHIISWTGEINGEKMAQAIKDITEMNRNNDTPRLLICSSGGNPQVALSFAEYVKIGKLKFEICIVGYADSAAVIILLSVPPSCRFCTKSATIFLHRMGKRYEKARLDDKELEKETRESKRNNENYADFVSKNTILTKKHLLNMMTEETELDSHDIVKFRFAKLLE